MGSFCKSGPATTTTQGNTSSTYTPAGLEGYQDIWSRVKDAASTPYNPYTGQFVADVNQTQQGGINNITGATSYLDQARNYANSGAEPITEDQINRYMNPFTKNVIGATQANFNESNAQQQNQVVGNAALKGALGGNRVGVAQAELARQQKLAQDPVIANLNQQGFNLALAGAQQDRAAQAQAGSQFGALGNAAIGQGQAQIGAGSLQQGTDQARLNAQYQEFMRQQQFPYQQAQFLAQTGIPALSGQGGTQTGNNYSQQQQFAAQPSPLQIGVGLGTAAIGAFTGNPGAISGGIGSLGGSFGSSGAGYGPIGTYSGSGNPYASGGFNWYARGGSVRHGSLLDTVRALRHSFRYGGGIPGYASGGTMENGERVYSPYELSPLDPPYGGPGFPGRARERDDAIRTILSEAGNQGPTGEQAVANVIRNRSVQGGFGGDNPSDVVRKPFQFEPWNTPEGRAKMAGYDPNSPEYQAAGSALDKAYTGDDPTKGATHFYSPGAQAALGRPAPAWDNGTGKDIGDHRFFGGIPGPGDGGATELTAQRRGFNSGAAGYTSPFGGRMPSVGPDDSVRNGLITAGLGILASRAPNAFQAIGEGGLLGMKQYTTGKESRQKNEMAASKMIKDAEEFAQGMDLKERALKETQRYHNILSDDKKTALARNALPGDGTDAEGKPAKGIYQFNPDTGRYDIFTPGIQKGAAGAAGSGRQPAVLQVADALVAAREEERKKNPDLAPLGREEAIKRAQAAPKDQQDLVARERLAQNLAKNDPSFTIEKAREFYGLPAKAIPEKKAQEPGFFERLFGGSKEKKTELKAAPIETMDAARKAIASGKDRAAVIQRLRENGFDPAGL